MKRVSKFHSIPCILTLAQQLYSVIHRRIYRQAFDDIALSSIFVQQYVVNGNKSSGKGDHSNFHNAHIYICIYKTRRWKNKKKNRGRIFSTMMEWPASNETRLENSNYIWPARQIHDDDNNRFQHLQRDPSDVCPWWNFMLIHRELLAFHRPGNHRDYFARISARDRSSFSFSFVSRTTPIRFASNRFIFRNKIYKKKEVKEVKRNTYPSLSEWRITGIIWIDNLSGKNGRNNRNDSGGGCREWAINRVEYLIQVARVFETV